MRTFWGFVRWTAFVVAFALDVCIFFFFTRPFSTPSFATTGLASLVMFLVAMKLANLGRGNRRISRILEDGEHKVHETCVHWVRLLRNIYQDKVAYRLIGIPVLIATIATLYGAACLLCWIGMIVGFNGTWFAVLGAPFHILPNNFAVFGFYIPLIFAIPSVIPPLAHWRAHRYVITPLRIIVHHGIYSYHMHSILLSRVIDAEEDYTFWQQFLGYGDVVFHETSGEEEKLECVWGPIKFAKIALRYSHAAEGRNGHATQNGNAD